MDDNSRYSLRRWFEIVDPGRRIRLAMDLLEQNEPSHIYCESTVHTEELFKMNVRKIENAELPF
jgi:hypothetical protein